MAISLSNELLNEPVPKVSELLEKSKNEEKNSKELENTNIGMKY